MFCARAKKLNSSYFVHADQERERLKTPLSFYLPHAKLLNFCYFDLIQYSLSLFKSTTIHIPIFQKILHLSASTMSANSQSSPHERDSDHSMTPELVACEASSPIHQQQNDELLSVKKEKVQKRKKSSASSSQSKLKKHKKKKSSHSSGLIKEKKSKKKKSGRKHETNRSFSMTDLYLTPNPFNPDDSSNIDKSGESPVAIDGSVIPNLLVCLFPKTLIQTRKKKHSL